MRQAGNRKSEIFCQTLFFQTLSQSLFVLIMNDFIYTNSKLLFYSNYSIPFIMQSKTMACIFGL